jgi:ABC-2 type transport system permease protein
MSKALLIAQREMHAYARSPLGAAIVAGALLVDGILFYWQGLTQKALSSDVLSEFFYWSSGVTMAASLILAMRLIAEERQTHTFTLLNTSPLKDSDVVIGKFLSAFCMLFLLTAMTAYMPALIFVNGKVSVGHIIVGYAGILLVGSATIAIGLFASSLARSQVVAAILGIAFLAPLLLLWMIARAVDPPVNSYLDAMAFHHENFRPFMKGILELRGVAYYVVVTYFFLLAATKILEARRWR